MSATTIGLISGLLVTASIIPYSIRTYQKIVHPNLTSWSLWSLIGLALLLTYRSSGAEANVWPAVFGFTNPLLITLLLIWQHRGWTKPNRVEITCLALGLLSLTLWLIFRENRELSQYAMYIGLIADACAAIPTIVFVWTHPDGDRPFAWVFYSIGYGLVFFAITEHTAANYVLPIYMTLGSFSIAVPLMLYRLKKRIPLSQWI